MRCANCGTELQGRPSHCPRCGIPLLYGPGTAGWGQAPQTSPQGPWQGAPPYPPYPPYPPQPPYPGYGYPQEGQAPPPNMPYGAYAPPTPNAPYGAGAPPSVPLGSTPGYQTPYPPGPSYGQGQQPYQSYGFGAPATIPFAPAAPAPRRRVNPLIIVLSIVCAVVVIAAAGAGVVYLTQHSGTTSSTTGAAMNTPGPTVLYQNAMTTAAVGWPQDQNCFFRADGYHIVGFHLCFAPISDQSNIDVKVDMDTLSGALGTPHGIVFRHNSNPDRYEFDVDPYGHWVFFKCLAAQHTCLKVVDYRANSAIHPGLHTVNTLEVIAAGTHFTFMVNGTQVGTADDSALSVGAVGLAGNESSEVVFSNLKISAPR